MHIYQQPAHSDKCKQSLITRCSLVCRDACYNPGGAMISKNYSIEEFVEAVKGKDPQNVITLAVKEATKADRLLMKSRKQLKKENILTYSRQLKQLINYHRYVVKPRSHIKTTYNLYMKYWGASDQFTEDLLPLDPSTDKMHFRKTA